MHTNTNYSRDLLVTEASWTVSRSLSTLRSNSASPDASRLALYRAINSRLSSVPCSSTLNSRWNLRFSRPSSKHWNALLTQRRIRHQVQHTTQVGTQGNVRWAPVDCVPPPERTHDAPMYSQVANSYSLHLSLQQYNENTYKIQLIIHNTIKN